MRKQTSGVTTQNKPNLQKANDFFEVIRILKESEVKEYRAIVHAYEKTGDFVALCQAVERLPEWNEILPKIFRNTPQDQIESLVRRAQEKCKAIPYWDNYLFQTVMSHEDVLQPFLDKILGYHVNIVNVNQEQIFQAASNVHGIRLDVSVRLDDGTLVDIEMQVASQDYLLQRMAYYRANATLDLLRKNGFSQTAYPFIRPTIIIFICAFNPTFVGNRIITVFEGVAQHDKGLKNPYMGKDIIFNLYGTEGAVDSSLLEFKDTLISDGKDPFSSDNELSKRFVDYAEKIRQDKDWRLGKMTLEMFRADSVMEGIEIGEFRTTMENLNDGLITLDYLKDKKKWPSDKLDRFLTFLNQNSVAPATD